MNKDLFTEKLLAFDSQLHTYVKDIDILDAIAPINYEQEKAQFFESLCTSSPNFQYVATNVDLFATKRNLFSLGVETLDNNDLAQLYTDVIESYIDKLDQYKSIGTPKFRYDSLRYYGEPSPKDIKNAQFILHLPDDLQNQDTNLLKANDIAQYLTEFAHEQNYPLNLVLTDNMIANALVSGDTVKINTRAEVNQIETKALAHHELGVHLVTTLNARAQPLNVLRLGSPVNTTCQEGIAILCEYLSGCLTISRLKVLALRVMAVESMVRENDFRRTFAMLKEEYQVSDNKAFTITARVYRGGGFTKDFLYLRGFHQLLNAYEQEQNFTHLLTGKVSLEHLPLITNLIESGYLIEPKLISPAIQKPEQVEPVQQFIAHSIK